MCLLHKWTPWVQYDAIIPKIQRTRSWALSNAKEYRKTKTCKRCGKVNDKVVYTQIAT